MECDLHLTNNKTTTKIRDVPINFFVIVPCLLLCYFILEIKVFWYIYIFYLINFYFLAN